MPHSPSPFPVQSLPAATGLLLTGALLAGCTLPGAQPQVAPRPGSSGASTGSPSAIPSPSPSARATKAQPSTRPSTPAEVEGALELSHVTRQPLTPPPGFLAPNCPRPSTVFAWDAMSPAGLAAGRRFATGTPLLAGTNHSAAASRHAYPAATVQGWLQGTVPQPAGRKIAFLTFDDGPTGVTTPQVLQILRRKKVPATFFVVGREVTPTSAGILRQAVAEGSAVAIHSYGHDYRYLYPHGHASTTAWACDMAWSQATLQAVLGPGYRTGAFRYPGGHMSWKSLAAVDQQQAKAGRHWIDWNAMTGDADAHLPSGTPAQQRANIARRQGRKTVGRDVLVVLAHDYHPNGVMVQALPGIIDDLTAQGYEFGVIE